MGKAIEQIEEEDDEIKKLNEVILNAKCHAIRDAQLIEKVEMKKEMAEEEKRFFVFIFLILLKQFCNNKKIFENFFNYVD